MARGPLIAGITLIAIGGAALGYGLTRPPAAGTRSTADAAAIAGVVEALDGELTSARAAVAKRSKALSEFAFVKAAVSTNPATAEDMMGRELTFQPAPGEVIELGQLPKDGDPPVLLVVAPKDGMRSSRSGELGAHAELVGDQLLITETAQVTPSDAERAKLLDGFVTVSRPVGLRAATDPLAAAGLAGRVTLGTASHAFGTLAPDAPSEALPLPAQPGAQLVVGRPAPAGGMPVAVVGGGAGVAGLGLILVLFALLAGKDRAASASMIHTQPGLGTMGDPKPAGPGVTAGTPLPVDLGSGTASVPSDLAPGAVVGRWEVVRRLGSGGMADVYLAQARGEAGFEKLVALKVMHGHLARNQRAVDHFLDEARLAARVHHPNVVAIQDLGKIGNDYVIVMEYVEGVDLERLLTAARTSSRPVPIAVALGILCRICDGLHAAHTAVGPDGTPLGIIHRDVKSANVLVSKQGGVKVVDFGIAKAAKQGHLTVAGETKGTPSMMAPEQRVGEQVDVRADVYSLAAVAYEIITGHAVNLDLAALAHLGIDNWPHLPPPSSLRAELPAELDAILLTAMAYDRTRRPADCAAFEETIEAVMKRNNLSASDKDIARWAEGELADVI